MEATAFGVIEHRSRRPHHQEFLEKPADPPAVPDDPDVAVRVDGQLRVHHRGADRGAARRTPPTRRASTTWGRTSSPASSTEGDANVYDFSRQRGAGHHRPGPWLLARRRHAGRVPRVAHGPGLGAPDLQPVQPRMADPDHCRRRCRRRSSSRTARPASRWSGRARSSPARTSSGPVVSENVRIQGGSRVEGSVIMPGVRIGREARVINAILDKNVVVPDGATSVSTASTTGPTTPSPSTASPWSARASPSAGLAGPCRSRPRGSALRFGRAAIRAAELERGRPLEVPGLVVVHPAEAELPFVASSHW